MHSGSRARVHLIGGDAQGWALDLDLRLTKEALTEVVDLVDSPAEADVIHTVIAEQLILDRRARSKIAGGKTVVAHFTRIPTSLFELVPDFYSECRRWVCVAQSQEAADCLRSFKIPVVKQIPYICDLETFFPVPSEDPRLTALRQEIGLPKDKYVIGSFQRDSLGADLSKFKPQKGADILLALLTGVQARVGKDRIHVLLAGPRRHWLRNQLARLGISYIFDGAVTASDDYPKNILSLRRLNLLTNLIDLYVIPSRWEGAPHALFQTIACRKKIISTDIAAPHETLRPEALFDNLSQGIDTIVRDIETGFLSEHVEGNHQRVASRHSVAELRKHWQVIYSELAGTELRGRLSQTGEPLKIPSAPPFGSSLLMKAFSALSSVRHRLSGRKSITIWGEMVPGPYGGGSQVLKAVARELERRSFRVFNNSLNDSHGHIMSSAFFDVSLARTVIQSSRNNPRVVHRIDGPISTYRGSGRESDEKVFSLNRQLATSTAYQSVYSWLESQRLGFDAVHPFIIRNATDPEFFFSSPRAPLKGRRIRIISTSWSTNVRKGFDTYQYLDQNLDFDRLEYTFVGRTPAPFENIRIVGAVPSAGLGKHLREADLFITASLHDPASNSLLEAVTSGLPVLYAKSGGHAEIAGFAGLGYDQATEIPGLIERLLRDYESYRICTYTRTIREIVDQYLVALDL